MTLSPILQGSGSSAALVDSLVASTIQIAGLAALAFVVGGTVGIAYRWYVHDRAPEGIAILPGLGLIALSLNTTAALGEGIGEAQGDLVVPEAAAFTIVALVAGGIAADLGRRVGDRLAVRTFDLTGGADIGDVSRLVSTAGRAITVELPDDVGAIEGYDPVDAEVLAALEGERFVFPRGLTLAELEARIVDRLKTDFGIGHVDLEVTRDGEIEYLAVGSRAAGIGPTLGPGTVALAVRADPANSASPGDRVQVWNGGPEPERVVTAELRAAVGDIATLAVDEADADDLAAEGPYRLVTLPTEPQADREFASLLRAADETMAVATVAEGSPLAGTPVGALDPGVVAVRRGGEVVPIPGRDRVLAAGDELYVVARPETLRRFEAAASGTAAA